LQRRAVRLGFGCPNITALRTEVKERWKELGEAAADDTEALFGDILFSLADLARLLNVDAESALRRAAALFERRFENLEGESTRQDG
jgi:ATP diphosphatase